MRQGSRVDGAASLHASSIRRLDISCVLSTWRFAAGRRKRTSPAGWYRLAPCICLYSLRQARGVVSTLQADSISCRLLLLRCTCYHYLLQTDANFAFYPAYGVGGIAGWRTGR